MKEDELDDMSALAVLLNAVCGALRQSEIKDALIEQLRERKGAFPRLALADLHRTLGEVLDAEERARNPSH